MQRNVSSAEVFLKKEQIKQKSHHIYPELES